LLAFDALMKKKTIYHLIKQMEFMMIQQATCTLLQNTSVHIRFICYLREFSCFMNFYNLRVLTQKWKLDLHIENFSDKNLILIWKKKEFQEFVGISKNFSNFIDWKKLWRKLIKSKWCSTFWTNYLTKCVSIINV
jgi:hypothetical protein